jgi:hypothetical protein
MTMCASPARTGGSGGGPVGASLGAGPFIPRSVGHPAAG